MAPIVYLSFAAQDAEFAKRLRADLVARGITVWAPPDLMSPGTKTWASNVDTLIRVARAAICVASPDADASPYVKAELATAGDYGIPVLFAWANGDTWTDAWAPPDAAKGTNGQRYIDVRGSRYETGLNELLAVILALPDLPAASAPPVSRVPPWSGTDEEMPIETERVRGWPAGHAGPPRAEPDAEAQSPSAPAPAPQPGAAPGGPDWSGSAWPAPPPAPGAPPPAPAPSAPAPERKAEQAVEQPGGSAARGDGAMSIQEQATFTAYCPKEVAPREWHPLLVYISADTAAALAAVNADAAERLGGRKDQFRTSAPRGPVQLRRQTRLTIVPRLPGFSFNPAALTVSWEEDVQRHEFRLSATSATPGQSSNGAITILEGPYLRAEIPISVFVQQGQGQARTNTLEDFTSALARIYRRIFPSYSRKDSTIVRLCEAAAKAMGDRYLMDLNILRSGERWDDRLLTAIAEADVFQLFWSETAARSPNVEREWRYALQLAPARPNFIRPVYWTEKPYPIPPELNPFHFDHLDPEQVGLKPRRFSLAALFGRA